MNDYAKRILELIGSTSMIALNANNVSEKEKGVAFKFRGSRNGNFLKIEYTDTDSLQIDLYRVSTKFEKVRTEEDVRVENLRKTLEEILKMKLPENTNSESSSKDEQ